MLGLRGDCVTFDPVADGLIVGYSRSNRFKMQSLLLKLRAADENIAIHNRLSSIDKLEVPLTMPLAC